MDDRYLELGHLLADFLDKSRAVWAGTGAHLDDQRRSRPLSDRSLSS